MNGIVYKITNKINNKIYIGQTTKSLQERWYRHCYEALSKKSKTKLGRAIRKYGEHSFSLEIVESTSNLNKREKFWIDYYGSNTSKGYNIKVGGEGGPHAKSTKNKITRANRNRVWTDEMRNNMSKAMKKWHKKRGFVPISNQHKQKITLANIGRPMSLKTKEIFEARNKKISKPIICIDTKKEYESIMSACRDLNLNDGHLRMHLKGKYSHVKGFHFKFKVA